MAYSSGSFGLLYNWEVDKAASTPRTATRMQALNQDIADALSLCVLKNGTQTLTADIPFNNKKITGLADATAATDALNRQTGDARYPLIAGTAAIKLNEGAAPATPASGIGTLYNDTNGVLNFKNDDGTIIKLVDTSEALISTGSTSAVATLDLTLPSTYTHFRIVLTDIEPATAAGILSSRLSFDSAATYKSDATYYYAGATDDSAGAARVALAGATQATWLLGAAEAVAAGNGGMTVVNLTTQTSGSHYTTGFFDRNWISNASGALMHSTGAIQYRGAATRATNIRFYFSTGNIGFVRYSLYAGR